jgi:hypothetical protein
MLKTFKDYSPQYLVPFSFLTHYSKHGVLKIWTLILHFLLPMTSQLALTYGRPLVLWLRIVKSQNIPFHRHAIDIGFAILINRVKWLPLKLAYACCCFCSYSLHYYCYSTFENSSNSPPSEKKRKSCLSNVLRDHPYITLAKGLGWWVEKWQFLLMFIIVLMMTKCVGGLE